MLRIIGDVHGLRDNYLSIARKSDFSVQVGDMDFSYDHLDQLDHKKHKFFGGNHDNYNKLFENPPTHYMGRYGEYTHGGLKFFYVGGAYSVDKEYRRENITWWSREEFSFSEMRDCQDKYTEAKPDIVLSHTCPEAVKTDFITNDYKIVASQTDLFLECLRNIHRPKWWIFGHHHLSKRIEFQGTTFICLNELCYIDISLKLSGIQISDVMGTPFHNSCLRNQGYKMQEFIH